MWRNPLDCAFYQLKPASLSHETATMATNEFVDGHRDD